MEGVIQKWEFSIKVTDDVVSVKGLFNQKYTNILKEPDNPIIPLYYSVSACNLPAGGVCFPHTIFIDKKTYLFLETYLQRISVFVGLALRDNLELENIIKSFKNE